MRNKPKHAPAPWTVHSFMGGTIKRKNIQYYIVRDATGATVCRTNQEDDISSAALICAGPDLLAACKIALHFVENTDYGNSQAGDLAAVRAAIAKAEPAVSEPAETLAESQAEQVESDDA